jgi:O-methyltransferase
MSRDLFELLVRSGLTYLSVDRLRRIVDHIDAASAGVSFVNVVEFGIALGGSAVAICKALPARGRYVGFDRFGLIPPPSDRDDGDSHARYEIIRTGRSQGINGNKYYGYEEDLYNLVQSNLLRHGLLVDGDRISLVRGDFADTIATKLPSTVSVAHIDCDWYDAVQLCINAVSMRLSLGGYIIVDDYNDWAGCRRAVDTFLNVSPQFALLDASDNAIIQKRR